MQPDVHSMQGGPADDPQPQRLAVKLYRTEDLVTVAAPMPGLGPGDVGVAVTPDRKLVIVGRLCAEPEQDCGTLKLPEKEVLLNEWEVGPYRRDLTLPADVDAEAATVTYGNGILVIALPVAERTRPARLTLESANSHPRGARVGQENRQFAGEPAHAPHPTLGRAATVLGGSLGALYLLRRGMRATGLFALAASALMPRLMSRAGVTRAETDARPTPSSAEPRGSAEGRPLDQGAPSSTEELETMEKVQEASEESFPASDPPSWTGTRAHARD
ncbi:MAG TPA: Hsp20/alpha crystallin family protein [Candidatus Binatia bacterium]|jgi:HSP20 family protein